MHYPNLLKLPHAGNVNLHLQCIYIYEKNSMSMIHTHQHVGSVVSGVSQWEGSGFEPYGWLVPFCAHVVTVWELHHPPTVQAHVIQIWQDNLRVQSVQRLDVSMNGCLYVGPVMDCRPFQGVPYLSLQTFCDPHRISSRAHVFPQNVTI